MDAARKASIVAAIVAAFESTGLSPKRGNFYNSRGRCACAVGVVVISDRGPGYDGMFGRLFGQHFSVGDAFVDGVVEGFDGEERRVSEGSEADGHDVGAAVWAAVSHLAPEVSQ